jgi:hypothetical protein
LHVTQGGFETYKSNQGFGLECAPSRGMPPFHEIIGSTTALAK